MIDQAISLALFLLRCNEINDEGLQNLAQTLTTLDSLRSFSLNASGFQKKIFQG